MRTSIAFKINIIVLLVVLTLGTALGTLFIAEQQKILTKELERRIQLFGGYLSESINQSGALNGTAALDVHLNAAVLDKEISYIIAKAQNGEILAARWLNQTSGDISEYSFPLYAGKQINTKVPAVAFGNESTAAGSAVVGHLAIGVDLSTMNATIKNLFWRTAGAVFLGAVASTLLGFFFVRLLFRNSMTDLINGIRRLGDGELSHRFDHKRSDEFGLIGAAFNDMASRLSQTLISKEQLENAVEERTAALKTALDEQVQIQNVLTVQEERIRLLLDSTAEAIYGIDTNGNCTFCNISCVRMLGYEKETDLLGQNMHNIMHHSKPDGTSYPMEECGIFGVFIKGEKCHCDSEVFWKADGSSMHVEYWAYPMKQGIQLVGAVVTFLDISERILLNEQLIQAQKMESVGRLAGGVAHDFNNMLTPIIGYAELLQRDLTGKETSLSKVSNILKAAEKAKELVQQLLSFSRKRVLEMNIIDLSRIIAGFQSLLRLTVRENIDIKLCLAEESYGILADRSQIEQVIMNLVVNAQDAIDKCGVITIETAPVLLDDEYARHHSEINPGRYMMLAVTDNGCGMDQETRQRIFEPFFTTKGLGKGTGLGLATVYGIVRQHGGNIWVYSEPGKGSTFKCYFPLVDGAHAREQQKEHEHVSFSGERRIILLVEDNEMVRNLVNELLMQQGFEVLVAEDPKQALRICEGRPLDLLITDVVMPYMTGPELHARLLESYPELKVLYMSGYTGNAIVHQGVLDEGIHHIQKPFAITEFSKRVETVLVS